MLALDDPHWNELTHAYGKASNIPGLLRRLALDTGPSALGKTAEVWSDLWSSLCHQGTIYTASYAAVPHLIHMASVAREPVDYYFFGLPVAIEISRRAGDVPGISDELERDYHAALSRLEENVWLHRHEAWKRPMILSAAAAFALAKNDVRLADVFLNLTDEWIQQV